MGALARDKQHALRAALVEHGLCAEIQQLARGGGRFVDAAHGHAGQQGKLRFVRSYIIAKCEPFRADRLRRSGIEQHRRARAARDFRRVERARKIRFHLQHEETGAFNGGAMRVNERGIQQPVCAGDAGDAVVSVCGDFDQRHAGRRAGQKRNG